MSLKTVDDGFGLLYYKNGSNKGQVEFMGIELRAPESIFRGLRYWGCILCSEKILSMDAWEIKDFAVLLPKKSRAIAREYTIVSKEWSPSMLEHYGYSMVGMDVKANVKHEVDEHGMAWV